jgi:hypothetical protein
MKLTPSLRRSVLAAFLVQAAVLVTASSAHASLFVVPEAALSAPALNASTIVHFDEIGLNSAINGQTIKGFGFLENNPGATTSNGGPLNTNHITIPEALSGGAFNPATYVLSITMPAVQTSFGFGFAILDGVPTSNALTITLFNGATNLGSLTYGGTPDPQFDGGFAGIGSTIGFTEARISFGPTAIQYAIDNVAAGNAAPPAVPEPGTALAGVALLGLCGMRRRR